jgi:UDP-N-acetylmuramoylalanine--D-glutamate ligase
MEQIAVVDGVRFVDDSVSTSPQAVAAAIHSFEAGIHVLIGGYDKRLDLDCMLEAVLRRCRSCALFGGSAGRVEEALAMKRSQRNVAPRQHDALVSVHRSECLEQAFELAVREARAGDVVLLSPGFASYDQFSNFTQRGELFRSLVAQQRPSRASTPAESGD